MRIFLIRHGETNKNIDGKLHAFGDSEALNKKGKEQMQKLAIKLKSKSIKVIYSSKEARAIQSAQILSEGLDVPVIEINGMQERNWGVFTGKSWSEVEKVLRPMSLEERYEYVPDGGESWKSFESRLIKTISKVVKGGEKNVAVVTHGGAIRALMPHLLNVPKEESFKYDPENAEVKVFDL